MSSMNHCYEVVTCRGRAGLSRDQIVSALKGAQGWLVDQPGFVERKLLEAEDGSFVDFVIWQSAEHAQRAAQAFATAPCAASIMGVLDDASVRMLHAKALSLS